MSAAEKEKRPGGVGNLTVEEPLKTGSIPGLPPSSLGGDRDSSRRGSVGHR